MNTLQKSFQLIYLHTKPTHYSQTHNMHTPYASILILWLTLCSALYFPTKAQKHFILKAMLFEGELH